MRTGRAEAAAYRQVEQRDRRGRRRTHLAARPPPLPHPPTRRQRGVAAIVAVPVLLILTVLVLMPRGGPAGGADFGRAHPFSRAGYESGAAAAGKQCARA